jgi:hypothetical protein
VHRIDANTEVRGHQDFVYIGNAKFTDEPGELRFDTGKRLVQADTDGDGKAEFEIKLKGSFIPHGDDFIL